MSTLDKLPPHLMSFTDGPLSKFVFRFCKKNQSKIYYHSYVERGLMSSADKGAEEGVLQMRTSALFGPKHFGFFKVYGMVCPHGQGG